MNIYILPSLLIHLLIFTFFVEISSLNKNTKKYYIDFISSNPQITTALNPQNLTRKDVSQHLISKSQENLDRKAQRKLNSINKKQIDDPDYLYTNTRNIKPSMAYEKSTIIDEDKSAYNITTYNSTSSSASSEIKTDKDFPYPYYITRLREVLFDSWKSKNVSATNISAIVKFRIYPNGEIRNISIEKSSSNNLFDYSVLSAVSEIKKVDPLPADFFEDYLTVYVEFKAVK